MLRKISQRQYRQMLALKLPSNIRVWMGGGGGGGGGGG